MGHLIIAASAEPDGIQILIGWLLLATPTLLSLFCTVLSRINRDFGKAIAAVILSLPCLLLSVLMIMLILYKNEKGSEGQLVIFLSASFITTALAIVSALRLRRYRKQETANDTSS